MKGLSRRSSGYLRGGLLFTYAILLLITVWSFSRGYLIATIVLLLHLVVGLVFYILLGNIFEKLLREQEEAALFHERLMENTLEGFAVYELIRDEEAVDFRYVYVNRAFEELTGLKRERVLGNTMLKVLPKTEPYWIHTYADVVELQAPVRFNQYSKALGRYYQVSAYPINEQQFGTLFVDITQKIQEERQMKRLLTREEEATRLKDQFMKDINHHMRTPLNGMMGMYQLLKDVAYKPEEMKFFAALGIALGKHQALLNQINKFVIIQDWHFVEETINVQRWLEAYIRALNNDLIVGHMEDSSDVSIDVDVRAMKIALDELVDNSIRYGAGKPVKVSASVTSHDNETEALVKISVEDRGVGIQDLDKQLIFNAFYHHDYTHEYKDHSFYSLSMCRQLLRLMGGDLILEDHFQEGSKFTILLPLYKL